MTVLNPGSGSGGGSATEHLPGLVAPFNPMHATQSMQQLSGQPGQYWGTRVVVPSAGVLHDMAVPLYNNTSASGHFRFAIYDTGDAANGWRTLLWDSGSILAVNPATSGTGGWQVVGDPNITVYAGQALDFAWQGEDLVLNLACIDVNTNNWGRLVLPPSYLPVKGGANPSLSWFYDPSHGGSPAYGAFAATIADGDVSNLYPASGAAGAQALVPLICRVVPTPVTTSYDVAVLADSPTSYWLLNDPSGTTAVDQKGAHAGTYAGTYTLGVAGPTPSDSKLAVDFLGTGRVTTTFAAFPANSVRTFEGFAETDGGATKAIFGGDGTGVPELFVTSATGTVQWYPKDAAAIQWVGAWPATDVYVHWALTVQDQGPTNTSIAELFINGASKGRKVGAGYGYSATPGNLFIGNRGDLSVAWPGMQGRFAVYPTILPADRIKAHYTAR